MENPTAGDVVERLDELAKNGSVDKAILTPVRATFRRVMRTVEGEKGWQFVPIKGLNADACLRSFAERTDTSYTGHSLAVYKSRFNKALTLFYRSATDHGQVGRPQLGHTLQFGDPIPEIQSQGRLIHHGSNSLAWEAFYTQHAPTNDPVTYPFPLSDGFMAQLKLPARLSSNDASRLAAFLRSLALDDPTKGGPM